jgi:D-glycero-D-manno-heptose 1,7-bisphosphate phosphatase
MEKNSYCRKPNPGMLIKAMDKWNIDKDESFMLGDSLIDAQAGKNAGIKTILIGKFPKENKDDADFIFNNIKILLTFYRLLSITQ